MASYTDVVMVPSYHTGSIVDEAVREFLRKRGIPFTELENGSQRAQDQWSFANGNFVGVLNPPSGALGLDWMKGHSLLAWSEDGERKFLANPSVEELEKYFRITA